MSWPHPSDTTGRVLACLPAAVRLFALSAPSVRTLGYERETRVIPLRNRPPPRPSCSDQFKQRRGINAELSCQWSDDGLRSADSTPVTSGGKTRRRAESLLPAAQPPLAAASEEFAWAAF